MSDRYFPVVIRVDESEYRGLAEVADAHGYLSIGDLLTDIAHTIHNATPEPDRVELLVLAGMTDAEIAAETHLLLGSVAARRRAKKLPPNHRYRYRKEPTK